MEIDIVGKYPQLKEAAHPPVATRDEHHKVDHFHRLRLWRKQLSPSNLSVHKILRAEIKSTLGLVGTEALKVGGLSGLIQLSEHHPFRRNVSDRLYDALGQYYRIDGSRSDVINKFNQYALDANLAHEHLVNQLSYPGGVSLEQVNEIRSENNPLNLFLLASDKRWDPKARFEAKRKLLMIQLAASIDRTSRTNGLETRVKEVEQWLDATVFSNEHLISESTGTYIVSTHHPRTWACTQAKIMDADQSLQLQPFQKQQHMRRRKIKLDSGEFLDVYITPREKPVYAKIIKMLRKQEEDPNIAVDDELGFLAVFKDRVSIDKFNRHIIRKASGQGHKLYIEDMSDTLDQGAIFKGKVGSSSKTRMLKSFMRLVRPGVNGYKESELHIEAILHTPETYAEYLFMRGVSHEEFEINRLHDSKLPQLLFPAKYYPDFDHQRSRAIQIARIRREIEDPVNVSVVGSVIRSALAVMADTKSFASWVGKRLKRTA